MKSHSNNSKEQFERAVEFLTEDIDSLSSAELRTELNEIGISATDAQSMIREAAQACRQQIGALKFAQAKQALLDRAGERSTVVSINVAQAKDALQSYWKQNPDEIPTTLAARKGGALSDETTLKIYQSLVDLGAISQEGETNNV